MISVHVVKSFIVTGVNKTLYAKVVHLVVQYKALQASRLPSFSVDRGAIWSVTWGVVGPWGRGGGQQIRVSRPLHKHVAEASAVICNYVSGGGGSAQTQGTQGTPSERRPRVGSPITNTIQVCALTEESKDNTLTQYSRASNRDHKQERKTGRRGPYENSGALGETPPRHWSHCKQNTINTILTKTAAK